MNVSVVIPTYNAERTIRRAVDSVLRQTYPPSEIIVLDDGSTDRTTAILQSYGRQITFIEQPNAGVAKARNRLCAEARGDVVAFLDHDDVWHPEYLQIQVGSLSRDRRIAAAFTGHVDFYGYGEYEWPDDQSVSPPFEVIEPAGFLSEYNATTGRFGSASFLCVRKWVLSSIGEEPFKVDGVDDSYLCTWLPLFGSVAYCSTPYVAYRITQAAQSTDRLKTYGSWVRVFELMEPSYRRHAPPELSRIFQAGFAARRRQYARRLMGAGRRSEARRQLRAAIAETHEPVPAAKALGLLAASHLPSALQPTWPAAYRDWRDPAVPSA